MPHFVIMGAGRVGVMLAHSLEAAGHTVAIIDQDERAFRRLRKDFAGKKVKGVGFDRETLKRADIDGAYAFAAVSNGDNSNILASRVARETFKVSHVVARINDPNRAEFFQRLGIPTVAAVRWSTDQVLRRILPEQSMTGDYREASGRLVLAELQLHEDWTGHPLSDIEEAADVRIAFITRFGEGMLPGSDTSFQQGDVVHAMIRTQEMNTVARILSSPPAELEDEPFEPRLSQRAWGKPASTVERTDTGESQREAGESGLQRGEGEE
ncbi:potassium channel family protein [Rothia uropygialis]|uniref:potassium channel family protein n=1 Tax=Kocuria sp. 36 TaxID=1415402 RepID=UPI00101CB6E4|nr:TrkA family potassium uptake protein [Kocuria sp. 36]